MLEMPWEQKFSQAPALLVGYSNLPKLDGKQKAINFCFCLWIKFFSKNCDLFSFRGDLMSKLA